MIIRLYYKNIIPNQVYSSLVQQSSYFRDLYPHQIHYLYKVLRVRPGREIFLFNDKEGEWSGKIKTINRKCCIVENLIQYRKPHHNNKKIILYFAPIKKSRMTTIFSMGSELGVTIFQPVQTRYTHYSLTRKDRIESQLIECSEQCGRLDIAKIYPIISWSKFLEEVSQNSYHCFAALERNTDSDLYQMINRANNCSIKDCVSNTVSFVIGPEGGWSDQEINSLASITYSFNLGQQILRSETAVAATLALYNSYIQLNY